VCDLPHFARRAWDICSVQFDIALEIRHGLLCPVRAKVRGDLAPLREILLDNGKCRDKLELHCRVTAGFGETDGLCVQALQGAENLTEAHLEIERAEPLL
jgi:hypothetical protein